MSIRLFGYFVKYVEKSSFFMLKENNKNMDKKRITVTINPDLDKKIRLIQAKRIQKENKSISYSHVVDLLLHDAMKKSLQ